MKDFVTALNMIRLTVWLVMLTFLCLSLAYARYRRTQPTGSLIDSLNSVHVAVFGFVLCLCAIGLIMAGKDQAGDKIFLSGASFIGGVGLAARLGGNGNGNGNYPAPPILSAAAPPPPPPVTGEQAQPATPGKEWWKQSS